jgi:hypothetical protein
VNWLKLFLSKLPDLPAPEVRVEEDGDLCCDWDGLSVSVSDAGRVGWAALWDEHKSHGHFQLPDWPEWFMEIIQGYAQFLDSTGTRPIAVYAVDPADGAQVDRSTRDTDARVRPPADQEPT